MTGEAEPTMISPNTQSTPTRSAMDGAVPNLEIHPPTFVRVGARGAGLAATRGAGRRLTRGMVLPPRPGFISRVLVARSGTVISSVS
jgi:hypothetical protein